MLCVTIVNYSVLVNGKLGITILPTQGLRQGDHLSPFLFLLCAEGLSSILNQAENRRVLQGAVVIREGISTNYLLFADDCVLFCRAITQEWTSLRDILLAYERGSRQVLNKQKTSIMFRPNIAEPDKEAILSAADEVICGRFEKYLGLLVLIGRNKYLTFKWMKDKIWQKLNN